MEDTMNFNKAVFLFQVLYLATAQGKMNEFEFALMFFIGGWNALDLIAKIKELMEQEKNNKWE